MTTSPHALAEHEDIAAIDVEAARLLRRLGGARVVEQSALLLSAETRAGASCVRLGEWAGRPFLEGSSAPLPSHADWRAALEASPLVGAERALLQEEAAPTPLVFAEEGRLYLYRWWRAEREVARHLLARAGREAEPLQDGTRATFGRFFETKAEDAPAAGQAVAAAGALFSPLAVVTGGPGTGKTYAAARLLALLLTAQPGLNVALAAPTGKAAKRLGASIAREATSLELPEHVREALPREAQTLHRLLGYQPRANRFRFDAERRLDVDAVLVDEASMVDLLMLRALLDALPERARLVFLGDEHQLASVDAGRVLADLAALGGGDGGRTPAFARFCREIGAGCVATAEKQRPEGEPAGEAPAEEAPTGKGHAPLRDAVVTLRKNYRFGSGSGIAALAEAVRGGEAGRAAEVLRSNAHDEVRLMPHSEEALEDVLGHARLLCQAGGPEAALAKKSELQVLAATYHGPWGVRAINDRVESVLLQEGDRTAGRFYPGRPVLVTANDYERDLFNGDLGVCAAAGGQLHVCFERLEASRAGNAPRAVPRAVPLARLPVHESAWAMTVHKSQGSEYDAVVLVLPEEMRPPLCRELVYTAVTRAKKRVTVVGLEAVLRQAVATPERRASGLQAALQEGVK